MPQKTAQKSPSSDGKTAGKTAQYTVLKVRLYPTAEQAELMEKTFGCCRYLWNQMLADVQEFYAATDLHYIPTPAKYKKDAPFLAEVDSQALCAVHQNLRKAFLDFFNAPQNFGYPQFKTKKAKKDTFTVYCRPYRTGPSILLTGSGIQMPKLGVVKAKIHRKPAPDWSLKRVIVTKTASGKYFGSIAFKHDGSAPKQVRPAPEKVLGLSHSLRHVYVDSDGGFLDLPRWMQESKAKLARLQNQRARMRRGSKNYEKQSQKIRLEYEHIANQRKDCIHKESRRIANACDAVCVQDIDLVKLSQQVKDTNVMDAGFGMFRECLRYKLAQQGKPFIVVDGDAPTAKTCHVCGYVCEEIGEIGCDEPLWHCSCCGARLSREVNAAKNILAFGSAQLHDQKPGNTAKHAVS